MFRRNPPPPRSPACLPCPASSVVIVAAYCSCCQVNLRKGGCTDRVGRSREGRGRVKVEEVAMEGWSWIGAAAHVVGVSSNEVVIRDLSSREVRVRERAGVIVFGCCSPFLLAPLVVQLYTNAKSARTERAERRSERTKDSLRTIASTPPSPAA